MAKTTDFTNFANERPNYFPGQYLLEDDFEIQHKYLSDRQRYHNQSLHISGIVEGLEVVVIQNPTSVQIKSGSAIDSEGNLIILKEDSTFSDFNNITNGELYIQYFQDKQTQQQTDVTDSYTRWIEKPMIKFDQQTPQNSVKLAKLTIQGDTINLDPNVREYSGLSLPNSNSKALTLRSGGNANPNLAVLTGSLKIDGDLTVVGTISGTIDTKNITSGILSVDRIPELSADKINSGTLNVDRIPSLSADKINSGTLSVGRIPDLSADKITSGTIDGSLTVNGDLTINLPGDTGVGWNKFVVNTTSEWGYGTQYVTIGAGGASGIMLSNPHITWRDNRASIRYGRTRGVQAGSYWDAGVRQDGSFSFSLDGDSNYKLTIANNGNILIPGAIYPSAGSTENNGIMFAKDPGGGSGDAAWIRYYSRNPNSNDPALREQTTLEIGTSNDPQDHIALMPSGGVGIGTNNPVAKLEVRGGQTKLDQEPWQTPTLENSWVNWDNTYNHAGYFKDSLGIVHLRGLVKNGTIGTAIFTLPVGYRPSNRELMSVLTDNNVAGRIDILNNGQVSAVSGDHGWISLDGITFRAT